MCFEKVLQYYSGRGGGNLVHHVVGFVVLFYCSNRDVVNYPDGVGTRHENEAHFHFRRDNQQETF